MNLGAPHTRDEMVKAFSAEHAAVHQFFDDIPLDRFFVADGDAWSPAQHLVHLWLSSKPIVLLLSLPKLALRLRFGKAAAPRGSLAAVRTEYMRIADAGQAIATGDFVPRVKGTDAAEKARILEKWQDVGQQIEAVLPKWHDDDLDKLGAPHPLIGKMTVRDLLFFTLYHNLHHIRDVQRMFDQPESEWFNPILLP